MKILSVNAGSSSLKFQLYEMPEEKVLISGVFERIGIDGSLYTIKIDGEKFRKVVPLPNHAEAFRLLTEELLERKIVDDLSEIQGVGHRIVQGADLYDKSIVIDEEVLKNIEDLSPLAPLHNPAHAVGIKAAMEAIPNALQVAVFDTSFHQTMKPSEYLYALPYEWYEDYKVRRYGFHGTSHKYVSMKMNEILERNDTKLITCHIGNGGSISAVLNGKCINTSMGFTPAAGLIMGSRAGDIDSTIIPYVMDKTGMSINDINNVLNKKSGVLAISGISSDFRDIEDAAIAGNERSILACEMYANRVVDYIAKYYVQLGGCDAIVFTAGVGENSPFMRKLIIDKLAVLGIKLDEEANNERGKINKISAEDSSSLVYVIPTDEEVMIARDVLSLL
jgi:acetate kinase